MKITFYGQNSLAIQIKDTHIIVDPFITGNDLSKDKVDIMDSKSRLYFIDPRPPRPHS